jgi:hypothetical protein
VQFLNPTKVTLSITGMQDDNSKAITEMHTNRFLLFLVIFIALSYRVWLWLLYF